jgi:glucan biosynthesis protein C
MTVTNPAQTQPPAERSGTKSVRLYYLDWLRVLLILGVFVFHALHPFDELLDWHIKNAERSGAITAFLLLTNPWAMPLFFLIAGAASKFALRRRSNRQYIRERVTRLLIPYIVGSILLSPIQAYLEALHKGWYQGSFLSFIPEMLAKWTSGNLLTPGVFGRWGFHLWFLAFLFLFSLGGLPAFRLFEREAGRSFISWLAHLAEKRGGMLLFVLPLGLSRVLFQPFSAPYAHGWLDFVYYFLFFILGYILYCDDRFPAAVRRDRWLLFASAIVGLVAYFGLVAAYGDIAFEWAQTFVLPWSIVLIFALTLISWGWAIDVLYLGMKYLNHANNWLAYGNETVMPFYLFHQPVIIVLAFFVVQWEVGLLGKLLVVVIGSFSISLGLIELLIRPFGPIRMLVGMKPKRRREEKAK